MHNAITGGAQYGLMPHAHIRRLWCLLVSAPAAACTSWEHSGAGSARTLTVNGVRCTHLRCQPFLLLVQRPLSRGVSPVVQHHHLPSVMTLLVRPALTWYPRPCMQTV